MYMCEKGYLLELLVLCLLIFVYVLLIILIEVIHPLYHSFSGSKSIGKER